MSVDEKLDRLDAAAGLVKNILRDRQPEVTAWVGALGNAMIDLHQALAALGVTDEAIALAMTQRTVTATTRLPPKGRP